MIYIRYFNLFSNNDSLTIEKRLRVQDFYLLRDRFNRAIGDVSDIANETRSISEQLVGKKYSLYSKIYPKRMNSFLGTLNKEEFIESFHSILDPNVYGNQLEKLFEKVVDIENLSFLRTVILFLMHSSIRKNQD